VTSPRTLPDISSDFWRFPIFWIRDEKLALIAATNNTRKFEKQSIFLGGIPFAKNAAADGDLSLVNPSAILFWCCKTGKNAGGGQHLSKRLRKESRK